MRLFVGIGIVYLLTLHGIICPPVDPNKKDDGKPEAHHGNDSESVEYNLEYGRYLAEVVKILEKDKTFAQKLENASQDDVRSGKIADHLELVEHSVRSKLDELKRIEVERLRRLLQQKDELERGVYREGRKWNSVRAPPGHNPLKGIDRNHAKISDHIDVDNEHTFEIEDLKKLIKSATEDLEKVNEQRREEFKNYEMEKEFEFQQELKNMSEPERKAAEKKHEEEKHRQHPQAHHPGSKAQLEQVWEQEDHMDKQDFDPKTFFAMHDLNSDGVLDEQEIEAILQLEAKRIYMSDPQHPGDPREMEEELNRMREHVFKEVDKNKDGVISKQEFLDMVQAQEFEQDEGWKSLDQQEIYTDEELKKFMARREQEMAAMYHQAYGYNPGMPPNMAYHNPQGYPPQGYPPQQGYHPNQGYYVQPGHPQQGYQPPPPGYQGGMPPPAPNAGHPQMNPQIPAQPQLANQQQGHLQPKVTVGQHGAPSAGGHPPPPPPHQQPLQQHYQPPPPQQQYHAPPPQQQQYQQPPQQQQYQQPPQQQQYQQPPQQQQYQQPPPQQQQYQQPPQQQQYQQPPQQQRQQPPVQQQNKPAAPAANQQYSNQQTNQYQQPAAQQPKKV